MAVTALLPAAPAYWCFLALALMFMALLCLVIGALVFSREFRDWALRGGNKGPQGEIVYKGLTVRGGTFIIIFAGLVGGVFFCTSTIQKQIAGLSRREQKAQGDLQQKQQQNASLSTKAQLSAESAKMMQIVAEAYAGKELPPITGFTVAASSKAGGSPPTGSVTLEVRRDQAAVATADVSMQQLQRGQPHDVALIKPDKPIPVADLARLTFATKVPSSAGSTSTRASAAWKNVSTAWKVDAELADGTRVPLRRAPLEGPPGGTRSVIPRNTTR